ncbi:MAG: polyphosphate kinase 1 [Chroococcus sp. CMT-3BRIN-NPC107]|jgi:polyphosphate kinase|nr:polyphosphate kinase 1 [Chroococcus sp. CMT-3BRIN-NPC107]
MPRAKKTPLEINLSDPQYYFNRELSWLEFNYRVLQEACNENSPLLERLKFLAIFSSNLDEFFMVRVAALKQQVEAKVSKLSPDGLTAQEQLEAVSQRLRPLVAKQHQHFEQEIRPLLTQASIHILDYIDLNQEQRAYLQAYFEQQIFPVLTPLAVDPGHPFPHISNLSLNLAVVVKNPETDEELFARVKVPKVLPRFLPLPEELSFTPNGVPAKWAGVPLEQAIAHNLESLFPGMNIQEYYPFRITRDSALELEEDEAEDLLEAIEQELRKRRVGGSTVRLEIQSQTPETVRRRLMRELEVRESDVYETEGLLGLGSLMSFLALPMPELKDRPWKSVIPPRLQKLGSFNSPTPESDFDFFAAIREQDLLVHHPYHSFSSTVLRFINDASRDPEVLAIKMTLYRTSGDSPIVNALIAAAENGKQVAVLVELKARFDEENNIYWARRLERVGVHVVYGLTGLKTHSKVVMVVRQEGDRIRRYVHIGTGNYNPKTARLYTDMGLFSCREDLAADLTDLFNYLTGYSRQRSYRQLLVAPVNMRDRTVALIRREMEPTQDRSIPGRIIAKMNSLVDPQIIATLYEASRSGVQIDLIVRGMCCLRPQVPEISENIRVISIVGRFLEHSRIYYFHNQGEEEIYIGSADWMPRNLDRRVEAITPVKDPDLAKELQEILGITLADNCQAWELQSDGSYKKRGDTLAEDETVAADPQTNSQTIFMQMALQSVGLN